MKKGSPKAEAPATDYSPEEREEMLKKMRSATGAFYSLATATGCHTLIEFTGLMNEFITVCEAAHQNGQDFPLSNTHTGMTLPFKPHHAAYLAEKLNCIYGPSLLADKKVRETLINVLFDGEYKLVKAEASEGARRAALRPNNYGDLSGEDQWAIDKELGILDWDGK